MNLRITADIQGVIDQVARLDGPICATNIYGMFSH